MLLPFILGIFFIELLLPLLTSIIEYFETLIAVKKAGLNIEIAKLNFQASELSSGEEEEAQENTRVIGFTSDNYSEEEDVDDNDD